ncbi:MAG: extracellular solute-binding protein [Saccharofermentanales bacterium]
MKVTSKMKKLKALMAVILAVSLSAGTFLAGEGGSVSAQTAAPGSDVKLTIGVSETAYATYIKKHKASLRPQQTIEVDIFDYTASTDYATVAENIGGADAPEGISKSIQTKDEGYIEWDIEIAEEGLYNIGMDYYTQTGKGSSITRSLKIDGKQPFDEAATLYFPRVFTNEDKIRYDEVGNVIRKFTTVGRGDEIRPSQLEVPMWLKKDFGDNSGYYTEPFLFYFTKGNHKIRFESIREPVTIGRLRIYNDESIKPYAEVKAQYDIDGYKPATGEGVSIQGENAVLKSDSIIYPITDFSSPATEPSSSEKTLLNTIGGNKWQNFGQWITYDFYVPETGLYKMGIKTRQNVISGQPSFRKLYIDGEMPFSELGKIKVPYATSWGLTVPGITKEEPYLFYLTEGRHTIKLEVTTGDFADVLLKVNELISGYTTIYRNLLMIVGPTPDLNRDYEFKTLIPKELADLMDLSKRTMAVYRDFLKVIGVNNQQAQVLINIAELAEEMSTKPERIAKDFVTFNIDISAMGALLSTVKLQPIEIDYISLLPPDKEFKAPTQNVVRNMAFGFRQFIASFYRDYSSIGNVKAQAVKVWIGNGVTGGRDQANVLNSMINNYFTSKEKVNVNLQLVPMNSLLSATLAKKGPDVALTVYQGEPVNYAIRGAVVDLSQFADYKEVEKRFQPSAMEPLQFDGKVYGLPEAQNFPMMFYRTDILEQLELKVPQTWKDVIAIVPSLQKKNLQFGLPFPFYLNYIGIGVGAYAMFLYQNGGSFYTSGAKTSALDSTVAINSFFQWTRFYTDYGMPYVYDSLTRFRTGELPILIADYGFYNLLSIAAPELERKWSFALVPGTVKADGTIDRSVASSVSACIILNNAKNKLDAWKFIKWWTTADSQQKFGREIESIMGPAARYQTANIEALYQIPWTTKDFKLLVEQWAWTKGIPEGPGSYMTPRYVDFAAKQVIITKAVGTDPGQILINAAKLITSEIKVKRKEFGLPD